jgi:hypothetical protein
MKPREIRQKWSAGNSPLLNVLKTTPLFLWLVFPIYTFAGESLEHSWENLKQLRVGQKTEVTLTSLKSVEGTWVDFSDQMITLKVDDQLRTIERPSVSRVSLREKPRRLRSTLLGLAIGGGAGLVVSAAFGSKSDGALKRIAPVCAGAGAGLGAAFPSYQTFYRAKLPQPAERAPRSQRTRSR